MSDEPLFKDKEVKKTKTVAVDDGKKEPCLICKGGSVHLPGCPVAEETGCLWRRTWGRRIGLQDLI